MRSIRLPVQVPLSVVPRPGAAREAVACAGRSSPVWQKERTGKGWQTTRRAVAGSRDQNRKDDWDDRRPAHPAGPDAAVPATRVPRADADGSTPGPGAGDGPEA